MPLCPNVESTIRFAENSSRVRLIEAMANGAPCLIMVETLVIMLFCEVFTEREHILAVNALIVDGVHEIAYQKDAQTANWPFLSGECGVGGGCFCGIEGYAAVYDDKLHAVFV